MNQRTWLALLAVLSVVAAAPSAQGFNMRTGTWEFTLSGMQGALPLDGIPPAMRAQIEAEMRKPRTYTSCVTAEDLKDLDVGKEADDDDECKTVTSKITATTGDLTRQCTGDTPRTETSHFEAPNPQTLQATISSKDATGTMTMTMTGKWLTPTCKD
jgi:hypothetical protein